MHETDQNTLDLYRNIILKSVGPDAEIIRAQSGLVNTVFLVDQRYVFRFPRDNAVCIQQAFERDVCLYLAKHDANLPIAILRPVDKNLENCFVYDYIPGEIMDEQAMSQLRMEQQQSFVQDLLGFIFWLGNTITPAKYQEIVDTSAGEPIEHWDAYINRTITQFDQPKYSSLKEVNKEIIAEMDQHYPQGITAHNDRVIHDDLHMGNLLFRDNKLSGVIDFGNVMVGDLACEFRHFYRLSPDVAEKACAMYEKTYGQKVAIDKVAWWARINDAATLCDKIMTGKIGSPSYERALNNLSKWYPDKNWNV